MHYEPIRTVVNFEIGQYARTVTVPILADGPIEPCESVVLKLVLMAATGQPLSEAQLRSLFQSSGVTSYSQIAADAHDPGAWARAFLDRVRAVREGGPCPAT